ncbi:MAG: DNA recombination protein RmuC [Muribaculaceae bacterium]
MIPVILLCALSAALLIFLFITQRSLSQANARLSETKAENSRHVENIRHLTDEVASLRGRENLLAASRDALAEAKEENSRLGEKVAFLSRREQELEALQQEMTALRLENSRLTERIKYTETEKERLQRESEERFQNIATRILNDNSRLFKETHETRLSEILTPLKENIESFKKSISDAYSAEARERFSLQKSIKELVDLNQTIGREAQDLTAALRGNSKVQGDWGEMILESILEKSGLRKGHEFDVQLTTDDSGNTLRDAEGHGLRPDVVVYYPDKRCIVIDSKVSLSAYTRMVNAESEDERIQDGKSHLQSVRAHIAELAGKKYQDYIGGGKTDFVMMFIPNEGAYIAAMQLAPTLWQEAYDARVLLVSPTHLFSALKLVAQLWSHDKQSRNAVEIAKSAGAMVDKFVGFVNDMTEIEKFIDKTRGAYDNAMRKLSTGTGNLVSRAQKLRQLGAKAEKLLPAELVDRSIADEAQADTPAKELPDKPDDGKENSN